MDFVVYIHFYIFYDTPCRSNFLPILFLTQFNYRYQVVDKAVELAKANQDKPFVVEQVEDGCNSKVNEN